LVEWKLHLSSSCDRVYDFLATDSGRAEFWAESASERDGHIEFEFPGGLEWRARILEAERPRRFVVTYFGETTVAFDLESDGSGGCELTLADTADDPETLAGWVSVLLALKAAVDFGIDLRNHDLDRTWSSGYADN
jgi:uncharacterized protein YndB with AHSA1/START domain